MKFTHILSLLFCCSVTFAQSLTMEWELVQNDVDNGLVESRITLSNHTNETLTADGEWMLGYCWMSVHPYTYEGAELKETEVCATYHTLQPTAAFQPLAPGETRTYKLLQKGGIIRETSGPEGAFLVRPGKQPVNVPITAKRFTSPDQWKRKANPGYASGEWMYAYNAPFCQPLTKDQMAMRELGLVPYPKEVQFKHGKTRLKSRKIYTTIDPTLPREGYRLSIRKNKITIACPSEMGVSLQYAMTTLNQLARSGKKVPCMDITDYPDLEHRGLMLDIVRNYLPKEEVIRIIDQMARYKLNVLHFHIADDEGWRVEISGLPELTMIGGRRGYTTDEKDCLYPAYCGGWDPNAATTANGYLTEKDYIDIVHHAHLKGIRVIPEIDMPGHSRAAIRAMERRYQFFMKERMEKEAMRFRLVDPDDTSKYSSAQYYTDDVICIAQPGCLRFAEKVMTELARMHNEAGQPLKVFHVGGDEVAKGAWEGSPLCQQYMQEHGFSNTHEMKDQFLIDLYAIASELGIESLGGWEEVAMRGGEVNEKMASQVDVISWCWNSIPEWRGDEKPYKLANAGYRVVLACVGNNYLDMSYTNHQEERALHWGGYTDEHSTFDFLPYDIYRSVRYTMKREPRDIDAYDQAKTLRLSTDPQTDANGQTWTAKDKLYGINGQVFAETLRSSEQLEDYIFPKLYGLAERGWNATPVSYRMATGTTDEERLANGRQLFETERLVFSRQIYNELQYLNMPATAPFSFHLAQPGIHIQSPDSTIQRFSSRSYDYIAGPEDPEGARPRAIRSRERSGRASKARLRQQNNDSTIKRLNDSTLIVTMNHPCPDAIICYTLDGTEPTESSPIYTEPFPLTTAASLLRAKAFFLGHSSATTWYVE